MLPVSKQPALMQAMPQAAIIPVFCCPDFSEISIAKPNFSATTKLSRSVRRLFILIDSIGNNASQPFRTTELMISACSRIFIQSEFPP